MFPILAEAPRITEVGGVLRVGQTGVTLETVIWAFEQGSTPEDIVDQYPTLTLADVYGVIAYYLRHREDVKRYLDARERQYRETAEELIRLNPSHPLKARLRARRLM
jgi:uncharacterized protein (DUF433 family)